MEIVSLSALPVASLLWQPRPGAWMFTFACKATYELRPGESELAPQQEELHEADSHWSGDPAWSLYAPRDIVPIRPRADVVLVGHAFAPNQVPVRSLIARLVVADVEKAIEVFSDRNFTQEGVLREGPRFAKMPLLYERAGGGPDTSNPVGLRADARDAYGKRTLPNLQMPGILVALPDDEIEPVGFGPIASTWPSRRAKLGRHAAGWSDRSFHAQPLPQDIDASYFNAAPRDQQTAQLRDNERIVLENLHPEHPRLVTSLSGHRPQAFVERRGRPPLGVAMKADLLWIHTDRGICTLTWRGQIPIEHPREAGVVRVALEGPGQVLSWEDVERLGRRERPSSEGKQVVDGVETMMPPTGTAATPFEEEENPLAGTMNTAVTAKIVPAVLPFAPVAGSAVAPPRPEDAAQRLDGTPFAAAGVPPARKSESSPEWAAVAAPPVRRSESSPEWAAVAAPARRSESSPEWAAVGPPAYVPFPAVAAPPPAVAPLAVVAPPPVVRAPAAADSPWGSGAASPLGAAPVTIGALAVQSAAAQQRPADPAGTGALGASNAAAAADTPWSPPRREGTPAATPAASAARPAARQEVREILLLVWFDPESVPRIRRQPPWRRILEDLEQRPLDKELDDPATSKEPMDIEDRREVFEILAHAGATDAEGIQETLADSVRDDGKYVAPLKLVAGDLIFPFDELETLKATVTTVTPLIGNDEHLRATVLAAQDFLKLPDLRSAPAVAEGLTTRIRDAFSQGKRVVPQGYLDAQTERVLLEQRHYQRRIVFGGPHLRALMQPAGSSQQMPVYLPDALAKELPMYQRFKARAVAEVHMQVDQYEMHPAALRALALVRAVPAAQRR